MMRGLAALFTLMSAAFLTLAPMVMARLPVNWVPWKRPDLDAAPTLFAHVALNHLRADSEMCRKALVETDRLRISYRPERGGDCGARSVVRVEEAPTPLAPVPDMTCALAAAFIWWQRDVQDAALAILKTGVTRIEHVGTFACRNVNGGKTGGRSQHAATNAIDIAAFVLADGRRVPVSAWAWPGAEGEFLRAVHARACRYFNGALGPDYNALHAGHFHLDLGPYLIYR